MSELALDVVVAGAGPAGIATAVAALRARPALRGRLLVIDRARFPRPKPCGGGLTGHIEAGLEALGLALRVPSFASPRALVRYGSISREVVLPKPVRTVRREEFDADLVAQARALGIEVAEGVALRGYTVTGSEVVVQTSAGEHRARVLVGADGVGSLVRRRLGGAAGHPPAVPEAVATGRVGRRMPIRLFRAELTDRAWRRPEMLYDFTPMRDGLRGYLWVFPVPGGLVNVGLLHDPSVPIGGGELAELLRTRLADHGIALGDAPLRGWPAWGYRAACRVSSGHLLTVGDAAGIDALTGEGIAVALEQGAVAGAAVARALGSGDFAFRGYQRALRRAAVGRDLALDTLLARLLYRGGDHRKWLSLVLSDPHLLELYGARVSGSLVLADRKLALARAFASHLLHHRARRRVLVDAEA